MSNHKLWNFLKKKRRFNLRIIPGANFMEYLAVRVLSFFLNALPLSIVCGLSAGIGNFLFLIMAKRRELALANLTLAYGDRKSYAEKKALACASFRHVTLALVEFFRVRRFLKTAEKHVVFEGLEHLDRALMRGKGVVVVNSHLGAWEYLAMVPYLKGYPSSVVVKPVRNPLLFRWVQALRKETKLNPIDKNKALKPILTELKKNHLAAILVDQWAGDEGLPVDFFGQKTSTTTLPARLAEKTGCALVPAYCLRTAPGQYRVEFKPEIPLSGETTAVINRELEREILRHPEQWTWAHRRWKPLDENPA